MEEKFLHKNNQIESAFRTGNSVSSCCVRIFKNFACQGREERVWMGGASVEENLFEENAELLKLIVLRRKKQLCERSHYIYTLLFYARTQGNL